MTKITKNSSHSINIPVNEACIDSLRIRVKLDKVKIIDKRLIEDYIEYYPTLAHIDNEDVDYQVYDKNKAKPITRIINGITYRIYIKSYIDSSKLTHEYVVFQVSAKMLKERYFEGINKNNIDFILHDINDLQIVYLTRQTFLQGLISDIDICINSYILEKPLLMAFSFIQEFAQNGKKSLIYQFNRIFQGNKNLGLEFNKREKGTNTTPYCKIYHKGYELLSKSEVFYNAYLAPIKTAILERLVRYEFTIKSAKHKEYLSKQGFKGDFKTLNDLLSVDPIELKKIAMSGLKHYTEKRVIKREVKGLSPTDTVLYYYIENLVRLGFDRDQLLGFTYRMNEKTARNRTKRKVTAIIDMVLSHDDTLIKKLHSNEATNNFLKEIGFEV
jgi:hypothetical protein